MQLSHRFKATFRARVLVGVFFVAGMCSGISSLAAQVTSQPVATACPAQMTKCPTAHTTCPSIQTLCPTTATSCPPSDSKCTFSKFQSLSAVGSFVQADSNTPSYQSVAPSTIATVAAGIASDVSLAVSNVKAVSAHTKATVRIIDSLPLVRIFESGSALALVSPMKSRKAGTAAGTATTKAPGAHSFLLEIDGRPQRVLRLQIRWRSLVSGKGISGAARVDVGNDSKNEFDQPLDGKSYLADVPISLDGNGKLTLRIETLALLDSSDSAASQYTAWLDVAVEPVPYPVASTAAYGTSCGPTLALDSWIVGDQRHFEANVDKAPPTAPVIVAAGFKRVSLQFPGTSCYLLVDPILLVPATTDTQGKLNLVFPTLDAYVPLTIDGQIAVADAQNKLYTSNGVELSTKDHSGKAFDHFDLNHVLSTGQSLSVGHSGTPVLSSTQPFKNKKFASGLISRPTTTTKLTALVESGVETMSSGLANLVTDYAENDVFAGASSPQNTHELLMSLHGVSGWEYARLKKWMGPYLDGMAQLDAAIANAAALKQTFCVRAVTTVHGETDHTLTNKIYDQNMAEWQRDYERDVQVRTGQTQPVPMLHSQIASWTKYQYESSGVVLLQLKASVDNPRRIPLVGPKYHLAYSTDGIHLANTGYRHMGEYHARVYRHVVLEGGTWEPLRPVHASRSGAEIEVRFFVPVPPLVLDSTLVKDPGSFGFEFADETSTTPAISKVEILDEDTVRVTLAKAPTGKQMFLRYAYTGIKGANAGPTTGPRGNLRDSDDSRSRHGNKLYNWCVHFELPVQ